MNFQLSKDPNMAMDTSVVADDWSPIDGLTVWPAHEDCGITFTNGGTE